MFACPRSNLPLTTYTYRHDDLVVVKLIDVPGELRHDAEAPAYVGKQLVVVHVVVAAKVTL